MKETIRNFRLYIEKNKSENKINLFWYIAGLATIPLITGFVGFLLNFSSLFLCIIIVIESLFIIVLSVSCAMLIDKFRVIDNHLKETGFTWEQIENRNIFDENFNKNI